MKPEIAIVENDIARLERRVTAALAACTAAEANARERRLELGRALIEARQKHPRTGRNAGSWSRFVADCGLDMTVALDAMRYAGWVEKENPGYAPGVSDPDALGSLRDAGIDRRPPAAAAAAGRDVKPANVAPQLSLVPDPAPQLTEEQLLEQLERLAPEVWQRLRKRMRAANMGGSGDEARGTGGPVVTEHREIAAGVSCAAGAVHETTERAP